MYYYICAGNHSPAFSAGTKFGVPMETAQWMRLVFLVHFHLRPHFHLQLHLLVCYLNLFNATSHIMAFPGGMGGAMGGRAAASQDPEVIQQQQMIKLVRYPQHCLLHSLSQVQEILTRVDGKYNAIVPRQSCHGRWNGLCPWRRLRPLHELYALRYTSLLRRARRSWHGQHSLDTDKRTTQDRI